MLIMNKEKRETMEIIELVNHKSIRKLGLNENYRYLGTLEADTIKQMEMKEKLRKHYHMKTVKIFGTKLYSRNLIHGINTMAVHLV